MSDTKARTLKGRAKFDGSTLLFALYNGVDAEGNPTTVDTLTHTFTSQLEAFGASQVIQTAYADADDHVAAAKEAFGKILDGSWKPGRMPGEKAAPLVVQAVAQVQGISVEDALATYETLDKLTKTNLRKHPAIAPVLAKLEKDAITAKAKKAKTAEGKVDVAGLFGAGTPAAA
jgi:hypothetical protein